MKVISWRLKTVLTAAVAWALAQGIVAETVFTADFKEGLPGWKIENGGTVAAVENIFGETALVVRRDPKAKAKGTNWGVIGEPFAVIPGRRLAVVVRARSTFKDLRFCNGFLGRYITGVDWYGSDGNKMPAPYGFGYDIDPNGWCYTVAATIVPDGAVTARLSFGMDTPNFTSNDWFAVSSARVEMADPKESGSVVSLRDDEHGEGRGARQGFPPRGSNWRRPRARRDERHFGGMGAVWRTALPLGQIGWGRVPARQFGVQNSARFVLKPAAAARGRKRCRRRVCAAMPKASVLPMAARLPCSVSLQIDP